MIAFRLRLTRASLLICALSCQAAPLYRIAGAVINVQSGSPLPRAHVVILPSGSTTAIASMVTGADGRFSFDVPEGKYSLRAGTRDSTQVYGLPAPDAMTGTAVLVGPGQPTENLRFRWFPSAAISGKIRDDSGEPAENALVQLVRSRVVAGRRSLTTAAWTRANDLGEYRFALLPAGTYYLFVTGEPWYTTGAASLEVAPHPSAAYTPVYYANTSDSSRATALKLTPGEEAGVDFTLTTAPGATVSVKSDAPPGMRGMLSLMAEGIGGTEAFQRQRTLAGGYQSIRGVPPGRYTVRVAGTVGASDLVARRTVEVSGTDVNVELNLRALPTVSGTVTLKNPGAKPRGSLLVSLIRNDTGAILSTAVKPDGSFAFPSVVVGTYRTAIRGSDGYFASEIRVTSKTEIRNGLMDLNEGDSVTMAIVASDEIGRVKGFAMNGDEPVAGSMVVLTPVAGSASPVSRGFLTDSDGSFDFEHVQAGHYLFFATADAALEYTNPDAVRPYLLNAKPIVIEPRGVYSENISISVRAPKN